MLVVERQQKITELIDERKSIRVTELSNIFNVTEETIRRDLEKLEKEKKLARSHGGAVCIDPSDSVESPYFEREVRNVAEKKEIANEAAQKIMEGDRIILDASSTAWYMAKVLPNKPVTVLTNSIKVAMELSSKDQINVISTGGSLLSRSLSFVGPLADSSLKSYHVNKAFISCKGLHPVHGISDSNEQQAQIKRRMIDRADVVYIMVDHTKVGAQSFSHIDHLDVIDEIIMDSKVKDEEVEQLKDKSFQLVRV